MKIPFPGRSTLLPVLSALLVSWVSPARGLNSSYDLALLPGAGSSAPDAAFFGAEQTDGFGFVSTVADLNGDGVDDMIASSYQAKAAGRSKAGKVYIWFGRISLAGTMDLLTTPADVTILGASADDTLTGADSYGKLPVGVGDLNGDGTDDLILGSSRADGPAEARNACGEAYVIFGRKSPAVFPPVLDLAIQGSGGADVTIYGELASGLLTAYGATATADMNGDGRDDLILGAAGLGTSGTGFIVLGRPVFPLTIDLATPAMAGGVVTILKGAGGSGLFFYNGAIASGDVNGDGVTDLVLGDMRAYAMDGARTESGEAYIIFGRRQPAVFPDILDLNVQGSDGADVIIHGASDYDGLTGGFIFDLGGEGPQEPLINVADVNGDGTGDIVLGSCTADGPGEARSNCGETYVIFGRKAPAVFPPTLDLAVQGPLGANLTIYGSAEEERIGGPGALVLNDVNGDGTTDLIIGAASADGPSPNLAYAGAVYVVFGRKAPAAFPAVLDLAIQGPGGADVTIFGNEGASNLTYASALTAGDINGDGVADLIFGAPLVWTFLNTDTPRFESGVAYVIFGRKSPQSFPAVMSPADANITIFGRDNDQMGRYGKFRVGDLNHDGTGDLIVTNSFGYGPGDRWLSGKAFVMFGGSGAAAPAVLAFSSFSLSVAPGGGPGVRIQATISGGAGAAGATLELQYSIDMAFWTTLATAVADISGNASFDTLDPLAGPVRFYRVRKP